jgi:tetratricopeptide (TPR) repeat protein
MNTFYRVTALAVVSLCLSVTIAAAFDTAGAALTSARQKLQKKDYAGARQDAEAASQLARAPAETCAAFQCLGQILEAAGDTTNARALYNKCLAIDKIAAGPRFSVLCAIAGTFQKEQNLPEMKKAVEAVVAVKGSVVLTSAAVRDYAVLATAKGQSEQALAAWRQILEMPELPPKRYAEAVFGALEILAAQDKPDAVRALVAEAGTNAQLAVGEQLLTRLLVCGLDASGKPGTLQGEARKATEAFTTTNLTAEVKVKALGDAAKFFMKRQQYGVVREFIGAKDALYQQESPKVYACPFMDKAPSSVEGWMASALVKDPRNRESRFEPYNRKSADLLINDVRSERAVGNDQVAADKETGFTMACDDRGWHIFVKSEDSEAEKVAAGLVAGGQLEMYFTRGYGEQYYQWLINLQTGVFTPIDWCTPHRGYRLMEGFCKSETLTLDKAIGTYIFFPWEMIYDRLPKDGDQWPFGVIRWTRAGGVTSGGKVHEIHKWGKVQWSGLTPEHRTAIQRRLVMKALGNYRKVRTDLLNTWKDDELGDPGFYKSTLLPAIEALDELGKKVDSPMSPADIESLFTTAVPDWMEIQYKVAELRREYLLNKLHAGQ